MEKQETYNIAKRLTNEAINQIITNRNKIYNEKEETMMMFLIAITKFIEIKQDIVNKNKNKKKDKLSEHYPKDKLQEIVFKGYFRIMADPTQEFLRLHIEKPIKIHEIKQSEEKNSGWIIDTIRDSIAHNLFEIDYDNQVIHILNNRPDRKLICDIDFYWLIRYYFILGTNKIENDNKKIQLNPIIYMEQEDYYKKITNINDIEKLMEEIKIITLEIEFKDNLNAQQLQKIKLEIYRLWNKITKNEQQSFTELLTSTKKIIETIKKKYNKFILKMATTPLTENEVKKRFYQRLQENPTTINLCNIFQKEVILKNIGLSLIDQSSSEIIEKGMDTIMSTQFMNHDQQLKKFYMENPREQITNQYNYNKEKLIALLYIKGITNFVLYKESIYDKIIDYNDIDLNEFNYYDYGKIKKLFTKIREQSNKMINLCNKIKQLKEKIIIIKENTNATNKFQEIKKCKEQINQKLDELNNIQKEQQELESLINISPKDKNNQIYIVPTKKEFFTHLRNAFAHTWIKYSENDDTQLETRTVEIEDYNDKGELVFKCSAPYNKWIELLNNEIFLEAIKQHENQKQKIINI